MYGWRFLILYRCIVHVMPRRQIANGWAQNDSNTKGWREYLMTQLLDHCGQPKPTNFARKISGLCAVKCHKSVAGIMFFSRHITCVMLYLRTSIVCNGLCLVMVSYFGPAMWLSIGMIKTLLFFCSSPGICDIRFNCIHSLPTEDSIGHGPKGCGWRGWWQTFELLICYWYFFFGFLTAHLRTMDEDCESVSWHKRFWTRV